MSFWVKGGLCSLAYQAAVAPHVVVGDRVRGAEELRSPKGLAERRRDLLQADHVGVAGQS